MALRKIGSKTSAVRSAVILGGIVAMGLGVSLLPGKPAQACGQAPAPQQSAEKHSSSLDLSNLTPQQQQALEALVAERREILPYQFLSLKRCPSLSNSAVTAFENNEYGQALALLDSAIAAEPSSLYHWLDRAIVHYYLGEEEAARADAKEVRSRFSYPRSHKAQSAYRQLMLQLDGELPDPRRAVEL